MKWNILHESRGRIRLHLNKPRLSMAEADQLQAYLADLPGVRVAVVYVTPSSPTQVPAPMYCAAQPPSALMCRP